MWVVAGDPGVQGLLGIRAPRRGARAGSPVGSRAGRPRTSTSAVRGAGHHGSSSLAQAENGDREAGRRHFVSASSGTDLTIGVRSDAWAAGGAGGAARARRSDGRGHSSSGAGWRGPTGRSW